MIRMAFLGSAAALALSLPAAAQGYGYSNGYDSYGYQNQNSYNTSCESERRSNQVAGGLFGAVAGGLLGAAIADDGDDNRRRGHRYSRGYDRGYGHGYRGRRHHRSNDNGDQVAGAVLGAVIGGVAGSALAGSGTDCNRTQQVYGASPTQRYGNMNVTPPTRQAYGSGWENGSTYNTGYNSYDQGYSDVRPGEELYGGGSYTGSSYGATTSGYNTGYATSAPVDTGECRTVYRERYINGQRTSEPATACNVGGDRWEFVN